MRYHWSGFVCAMVFGAAGLTEAQSLAEVARAAEARNREAAATQPAKVYTNKDLVTVADAPATVAASPPAPLSAPPAAAAPSASSEAPEKTEGYWKARMRPLREQLDRDRQLHAASQARADALAAAADQCFRIGVVCLPYTESLAERAESERLRADVARDERAVRALEEEARRAGIPPGWLRP